MVSVDKRIFNIISTSNVRFFVSATYGVGTVWSPAVFNLVNGLRRQQLMITHDVT